MLLWWGAKGNTRDYWNEKVLLCLQFCLHQSGVLEAKFKTRSTTYANKIWKPAAYRFLYGEHHIRTENAAREVLGDPPCCQDEQFTRKALSLCPSWRELVSGPIGNLLFSIAARGEKHEANVDLENDQAVQNWLSSVKGTISVDMMCESASMMQWVREQLNRNGKVESYITKERIVSSGAPTRQGKKKEKRKGRYRGKPSGWFLYKREVVSKEWRAKRRDDAAQRVADRDRELLLQNRGRVIRSESWKECLDVKQGGLASWDEFLANAWEKYNADQDLKDEFNRKAALYTKPAPVAKTKARGRKDLDAKDTLWQAGYNRGPCSPAVLEKAVRSHKRPHKYSIWSKSSKPRLPGPCNTGKYLGETQALDPMICDDRPRRYTNEKVNIAKLCSDKFPGFCVTEGAHFKNCVLRTCCNFNTVFAHVDPYLAVATPYFVSIDTIGGCMGYVILLSRVEKRPHKVQWFAKSSVLEFDEEGIPKIISLHFAGEDEFLLWSSYGWVWQALEEVIEKAGLTGVDDVIRLTMQQVAIVPNLLAHPDDQLTFSVVRTGLEAKDVLPKTHTWMRKRNSLPRPWGT